MLGRLFVWPKIFKTSYIIVPPVSILYDATFNGVDVCDNNNSDTAYDYQYGQIEKL